MHLSPPGLIIRLPSIILRRWFRCCWFVVLCTSHCLWGFCVGICSGMHYFVSFLVLQSSWQGRESWLLCFNCLMPCYWVGLQCVIVIFPDHIHFFVPFAWYWLIWPLTTPPSYKQFFITQFYGMFVLYVFPFSSSLAGTYS